MRGIRKVEREVRGLARVQKVFEELGRSDPLYAALSRGMYRGNKWDPAAFFANGVEEIEGVIGYADSIGLSVHRGRALDFGCAVGRLTQALANHFKEVVGVDIAASMVEQARQYNQHGERVQYLLNTAPDLTLLETASFDFVYSNKVLQHIHPTYQEKYIAEFVRVLRPGGAAIFQTRNGPRFPPGTPLGWLYTLNYTHLRRLFQWIRGRPLYEMHFVSRSRIEQIAASAGARIIDVVDLSLDAPGLSLRYCIGR